ncbi:CoA ester lyase [Breoghania sp. L-A4]|uniref:HpcH/HpaI aldolase/citrate lyase family protein n=1 Tax=Breoghania sp. L-A4 TaxID=2304600 RepID=UPI000E3580D9|nr:CoA ester lyase [Breoghania sp. L-A4]AXS42326.1 CoA ester lyase [Breoghania sp. L-A4]
MTTAIRPRRSALYMPGSNARALDKARGLDADVLILDLEDAVAPDAKDIARAQIVDAVTQGGYGPREVIIRINGLDTPWGEADLKAAVSAKPDGILIPKVSSPADVQRAAAPLNALDAPESLKLWAMMETPLAMLNAGAIAAAAQDPAMRLSCFVMGTNDLAKETGARLIPGRLPMVPWLMSCIAAAKAYGLDVLDGVYNDFSDLDGLSAECEQGRDMGMDGKTLIHPKQLDPCNRAFSASQEELEAAKAIIAAFELEENAGKGAINLGGRMVERMHADIAKRQVAIADAVAARAANQ